MLAFRYNFNSLLFALRDLQPSVCILTADLGTSAVVRVIEQCCFNSVLDPFNGQTVNFILKPPKVIESRTYVKKANLEHY